MPWPAYLPGGKLYSESRLLLALMSGAHSAHLLLRRFLILPKSDAGDKCDFNDDDNDDDLELDCVSSLSCAGGRVGVAARLDCMMLIDVFGTVSIVLTDVFQFR